MTNTDPLNTDLLPGVSGDRAHIAAKGINNKTVLQKQLHPLLDKILVSSFFPMATVLFR
jgi:hypothetical protein